jgi:spore coat protein U-like protein
MKRLVLAAAALSLALVAAPASADTVPGTLTVTADVKSVCTVAAATLDFDDYDPVAATAVDNTTNIAVTCTKGTGFQVSLDKNSSAMTAAGKVSLNYTLFSDVNRTTAFPLAAASGVADVGAGATVVNVPVYGRIAAGQTTVEAGTRTDAVSITVTY